MEGLDYDAAASTIKIEDITSDPHNRNILRQIKANDPNFDELFVRKLRKRIDRSEDKCFCPGGARELGWVGYYIGQNTNLS